MTYFLALDVRFERGIRPMSVFSAICSKESETTLLVALVQGAINENRLDPRVIKQGLGEFQSLPEAAKVNKVRL